MGCVGFCQRIGHNIEGICLPLCVCVCVCVCLIYPRLFFLVSGVSAKKLQVNSSLSAEFGGFWKRASQFSVARHFWVAASLLSRGLAPVPPAPIPPPAGPPPVPPAPTGPRASRPRAPPTRASRPRTPPTPHAPRPCTPTPVPLCLRLRPVPTPAPLCPHLCPHPHAPIPQLHA